VLRREPVIWDENVDARRDEASEVSCRGLAHQPDIPPTLAASKVTPSGNTTRSMTSLNGPRAAVPSNLPFMGATTDRRLATASESSLRSECTSNQGTFFVGFLRMSAGIL